MALHHKHMAWMAERVSEMSGFVLFVNCSEVGSARAFDHEARTNGIIQIVKKTEMAPICVAAL